MDEQTVKCPVCGAPYNVYPFYAGDQSACPNCRDTARGQEKAQEYWDQIVKEIQKR